LLFEIEIELQKEFGPIDQRIVLRQRRLHMTPTLMLFQPSESEESNRVIRKYSNFIEYFFRISFVNEK